MRITLLCMGTRGDVQPFVALALGLAETGHTVTLAAGQEFEGFVTKAGIAYRPLRVSLTKIIQSDGYREFLSASILRKVRYFRQQFAPIVERTLVDCWEAARGSDAIVFHPSAVAGPHVAEKLDVPAFAAVALPALTPTREFSSPNCAMVSFGGMLNHLTHPRKTAFYAHFHSIVNRWRNDVLALPRRSKNESDLILNGAPIPVLYSYSQHVLPRPFDWSADVHVTGYWFLKDTENWQVPSRLRVFMESGTPPIYVGFGSMVGSQPEQLTATVLEAVQRSGQRAILAIGWGGLVTHSVPEDQFFVADSLPHSWLFPRVSAVVHHGGSGTTAAGLRAGRPSVICPHMLDQPFWGSIINKLGIGPPPIPLKKMSARQLANSIQVAVTDRDMRERAEEVGQQIRNEDGVTRAITIIEKVGGATAQQSRTQPPTRTPTSSWESHGQSDHIGSM